MKQSIIDYKRGLPLLLAAAVAFFCLYGCEDGGEGPWEKLNDERESGGVTWNCGASGANVKAVLNGNGTLTVSGSGQMMDYEDDENAPWYDERSSITKAVIESGVTTIGKYAFYDCDNLMSVTIPNSVTSIGEHAFGFTALMSITIPNSVMFIGEFAFIACDELRSITIPKSVTYIGDGPFAGCDKLMSITVASDNAAFISINGVLFNKNKTTLIQYPAGKQDVDYVVSSGVTSILHRAFWWCENLKSITIPNSVTTMGSNVFAGCRGLEIVNVLIATPPVIDTGFFSYVNRSSASLYVPANSVSAYKNAAVWKSFGSIQAYNVVSASPAGDWLFISRKDLITGQIFDASSYPNEKMLWTLNSSGKFVVTWFNKYDNFWIEVLGNYQWRTTGSTLYSTDSDGEWNDEYLYSVSGNNLTVSYCDEDGCFEETFTTANITSVRNSLGTIYARSTALYGYWESAGDYGKIYFGSNGFFYYDDGEYEYTWLWCTNGNQLILADYERVEETIFLPYSITGSGNNRTLSFNDETWTYQGPDYYYSPAKKSKSGKFPAAEFKSKRKSAPMLKSPAKSGKNLAVARLPAPKAGNRKNDAYLKKQQFSVTEK